MATLTINNLDDEIYKNLQILAEKHGVSIEEEVRRILTKATTTNERIGDIFLKNFGKKNGVDLELPKHEPHEPIDLSKCL